MKLLFITNGKNQRKLDAIKLALEQNLTPDLGFTQILCEDYEARPMSEAETIAAAEQNGALLLREASRTVTIKAESIAAIVIQKGITIFAPNDCPPKLIYVALIAWSDKKKKIVAITEACELSMEVRRLVTAEGSEMELYDALEKVYGEKIKTKEISLYEHCTGKKESKIFLIAAKKALDL